MGTDPLLRPAGPELVLALVDAGFVGALPAEFVPAAVTEGESDSRIEDFAVSAFNCLLGSESPARMRELLSMETIFLCCCCCSGGCGV